MYWLGGWRPGQQPRSASRLGVEKRSPRVRSHSLQGRIACKERERWVSYVRLFAAPWTVALQAPLLKEFVVV